jgi:hypothetical protein
MLEKVRSYRLSKEGKIRADRKRQNVQENFLKMTHQQRQEAAMVYNLFLFLELLWFLMKNIKF